MSDAFQPTPDADQAPDPMADPMWPLVVRDLAGETTPEESAAVTAWLADHPEDAAVVALVKARATRHERQADIVVDTEGALHRVTARIAEAHRSALTVSRGGQPARTPALRTRRWWTMGAAAAALIGIMAVTPWRTLFNPETTSASPRVYRTATGVVDSLRLPDGSTVVLAPGSELTLASGFGNGARTVTLRGAAFFEVEHDVARPFVVRVNDAEVRDLGTAFTIRTGASGAVSVAVTHGIVALRPTASRQQAELRAGDQGMLAAGTVTVRRGVVTTDDVAWTRGLMHYRDTPLDVVQSDLERWYGLTVRMTDPALARRTLTASFRADSSAQAIRLIALAIGADAVVRGDTVLLRPVDASPDVEPARVP